MIKLVKKILIFSTVCGLLLLPNNFSASAYSAKAKLTKDMTWANSDSVRAHQISVYGKVSDKSKKSCYFYGEYYGNDGKWHYDVSSIAFTPGTKVPTLTQSYFVDRIKQRLQINPVGIGVNGKGGIAVGYLNRCKP